MTPEAIAAGDAEVRQDVQRAIAELLMRADRLYASARSGFTALPWRLRFALAAAAAMYAGIGSELKGRSYNRYLGQAYVPASRKLWLSIRALTAEFHLARHTLAEQRHAAS